MKSTVSSSSQMKSSACPSVSAEMELTDERSAVRKFWQIAKAAAQLL